MFFSFLVSRFSFLVSRLKFLKMMLRLMLILSICFLNSIICNFKINELYPLKKGDA